MAYQKQKNIKNGAFVCAACGARVTPEGAGSAQRNHCPECLCSLHLDTQPGDRAAGCGGVMEAVGVWVRHKGEWALIHRCRITASLRMTTPSSCLPWRSGPLPTRLSPGSCLGEWWRNACHEKADIRLSCGLAKDGGACPSRAHRQTARKRRVCGRLGMA